MQKGAEETAAADSRELDGNMCSNCPQRRFLFFIWHVSNSH